MSDKTTILELPVASSVQSSDSVVVQQGATTKQSLVSTLIASLGAVASVAWTNITGKPTTFPPSAHVHPESEVTNLVTDLAAKASAATLTAHTANVANPHAVTKAQVGLANSDNTADSAKPISTAQQAALDAKVAGPVSSTTDRIALFNGTTGKLIKEAAQTIANLLSRTNHTGQQPMSTISDAGQAATMNIGTIAGTVAAGNDARILGAAQTSNNGSDFPSKPTFRTNLDLEAGIDFQAWRSELDKYGLKGAGITAAATIDLGAGTGLFIDISGTTTIVSLGTAPVGTIRIVRFIGALILTHNAVSLILPGAANITTAGNDGALFISLGSGNWWCASYQGVVGGGGGSQPLDADLTAIAALTTTANGRSLLTAATLTAAGLALTNGATIDSWGTKAVPTGVVVGTTDTQTLTAKTLTAAILNGTLDISQAIKFSGITSPTALTVNTNDYAPSGFATATVIRLSASAAVNITGITGGVDGLIKILHNVGAFTITLKDEDGGSITANKFALTADVALAPDAVTTIQYDVTSARWRVIGGAGAAAAGTSDVIQAITFAASITPTGTRGVANVGTLTGDILINNPSGSPTDGTMLSFRLVQDGAGGRVITWGSNYAFGTDITSAMLPTTASAKYEAGFRFHTLDGEMALPSPSQRILI